MSVISRIKTWLTNRRPPRRPRPQRPATAPAATRPQPAPMPASQPAATASAPVQYGPAAPLVHVTLNYFLSRSSQSLKKTITLTGYSGAPLTLPWTVLPGYVLVSVTGFTASFPATNTTITYYYEPRLAGPVLVYHRTTTGRLLSLPEILRGPVNTQFTAEALPEMADQLLRPARQNGTFTTHTQTLHFTYNVAQLENAQAPEQAYITLNIGKTAFLAPEDTATHGAYLPAGTAWRVYTMVREPNQTVWLNLGGELWITASDTTPQTDLPFLPGPMQLALPTVHFEGTTTAMNQQARISAGPTGVTTWDAPYGQAIARLASGTAVHISAKTVLADHSEWLETDCGLVLANYVEWQN
ncbi:MucBP domain-containing protein [Lacticaseibacillus mingshuiensis]|uniref:MucBP domain-containing protein n=1 Tax=Lacticaseibacillus mingshuiensis TaxID=2799574 RepID=UPI001952149F|nr:MucBP domain-containing protein [Lacticaseibacillus mingshuiensis]